MDAGKHLFKVVWPTRKMHVRDDTASFTHFCDFAAHRTTRGVLHLVSQKSEAYSKKVLPFFFRMSDFSMNSFGKKLVSVSLPTLCLLLFFCSQRSRWWFQIFCIFIPTWGRFPFWLIFSDGLKPPTSSCSQCSSCRCCCCCCRCPPKLLRFCPASALQRRWNILLVWREVPGSLCCLSPPHVGANLKGDILNQYLLYIRL